GHRDAGEGIPNGETRVTVGPRVHDRAVAAAAESMNVFDELPLAVALHELERGAELTRYTLKPSLDVVQCFRSVDRWLTYPEQIEVRTVDDGDPHVFFNPSSHALNCWMSSLCPAVASGDGSASAAATS